MYDLKKIRFKMVALKSIDRLKWQESLNLKVPGKKEEYKQINNIEGILKCYESQKTV